MKKSKAMKTFTSLLLLILILTSAIVFAQNASSERETLLDGFMTDKPNELFDIDPNTYPGPVQFSDDQFDLLFEYPCGNTTGEAGVETDGNFIYTSLWNGTEFCKYAPDGTYLGTFSIPGVAAVRDMAYDGTYFYGSAASTLIFEMDFTTQTLISTFVAPTATRAIAYNEWYDSFYVNNWSTPIVNFDRSGQTISTIPTAGDESYYGFAYDPENLSLWGYSQKSGTSLNMLYEISLPGGNIIDQFDMCSILTLPTPGTDIAGGLYFDRDLINDYWILGGIAQNICLWGIELYFVPGPPEYDVGVKSFISPVAGPDLGEEIVTVRVKNYGSVTQSNIPVSYTVDGGTPITGIVPGPILWDETEDFTFPGTVNLSNPGQTYILVGCTSLVGDEVPGNDCKTVSITNMLPGYCNASTTTEDEYIANVLCESINNSSGWQGGVADYTVLQAYGYAGGLVNITVTNGTPWANDRVTVWVDWNQDSIFNVGTNEEFILTNIGGIGATFSGSIVIPAVALDGDYRMRIRLTYSTPPNPCGNADYGEIEDYTIVVYTTPQNDVGVYSFSSPTSGPYLGEEEIVTIRIKNFGGVTQNNIPVYYTLDGGTQVTGIVPGPISPGETEDFTFPGTVNLSNPGQSYVFVGCTELEGDDNPANNCKTIMIVGWPVYCDASTTIQREYITQVNFGNIYNSSDWQGGVADYTALSTYIEAGGSQYIYVSNPVPNSGDMVFVWVDWNMDYTFNVSGNEQYILFNNGGTGSDFFGYITVPLGTPTGDYRMRIRLNYGTAPIPCGNAVYGEVEDYTITVDTFPPPSNLQATLTGNDVFLTWDSPPESSYQGILGYNIYRNYNLIGFVEVTNYNDNDVAPGTYDYFVAAKYDYGESVFTGPATVVIPGPVISVNPNSVTQNIHIGEVAESTLEIANSGTVELTYTINVEFLNPPPIQPETFDAGKAAAMLAARMAADGISADLINLSNCNPGGASSNQKENEVIRYDDGKNFKAIGLTTGGTFEVAIYFQPATIAKYEGWILSQIGFYINQVPEICKIKVYGKGTPTLPGELLYEEIVNPTGFSWNLFTLNEAVELTVEDLWLGFEITHQAGTTPAGCDNGPAIAGFGDMISFNNVTWAPLSNCGLNYNWNLVGYLVDESPMATNDVGVQTHLSPTNGTNLGEEVVTITVKNYGTAAQSNIPVFYYMGGGDTITGTITGTLASGETTDYTFDGTVNLGNVGITYAFHACTALAGDENATNDCHYFTVTNINPEYCPATTLTEDEYIANVLMGSINNSSGWQNSVSDYTAIFTTIHAGISENITVTNGTPYTSDIVYVWVDWNQDYTFGSGEEFFMLTNVGGTGAVFTGSIMAPAGQANGNYRMRIRMTYSTPPQPCCSATYGEIEDYSIKVDGDLPGWLNVPITFGTVAPGDTTTVSLHFDAVGLTEGTYDATLIIANNSDNYPVLNVPVTLIVGQCPLPPPLNLEGIEILPNVAQLTWQVPEPSGNLLGYNIYRNNEKINDTIIFNTFYEDSLLNPSQYLYFVTVVYPECEASSDTISVVITNLTEKENDGVSIFPNPATNSVNIKSQNTINQISILNNLGLLVYSGDFESQTVQLNTSSFRKGIYIIHVKTVEGSIVKKLVME